MLNFRVIRFQSLNINRHTTCRILNRKKYPATTDVIDLLVKLPWKVYWYSTSHIEAIGWKRTLVLLQNVNWHSNHFLWKAIKIPTELETLGGVRWPVQVLWGQKKITKLHSTCTVHWNNVKISIEHNAGSLMRMAFLKSHSVCYWRWMNCHSLSKLWVIGNFECMFLFPHSLFCFSDFQILF